MSIGPLGSKFFGNIIDSEKPLAVRAYTTHALYILIDPSGRFSIHTYERNSRR